MIFPGGKQRVTLSRYTLTSEQIHLPIPSMSFVPDDKTLGLTFLTINHTPNYLNLPLDSWVLV
jgi:hypothetical protein